MKENLSEYEGKMVVVFGPEEHRGSKIGRRGFVLKGNIYTVEVGESQISLMEVEKELFPRMQVQSLDKSLMTSTERELVNKAQQIINYRFGIGRNPEVEGKPVIRYANAGGVCELCYGGY